MPEKIVIYELYSNDASDMTYKLKVSDIDKGEIIVLQSLVVVNSLNAKVAII